MKIYTLGSKRLECRGHGDFGEELAITKNTTIDDTGVFPPVFTSRRAAEDFLATVSPNVWWNEVVELELFTDFQ